MRKFFSVILVLCLSCGLFCGCGADSDVTVSVQSVSMLTGVSSIGMYSRYAGIVQSGDVEKIENLTSFDKYYENYIPFNKEVTLNDEAIIYVDDDTYFKLNKNDIKFNPIIIDGDKYYFEYNDRLVYVLRDSIKEENSTENEAKSEHKIPVDNPEYHVDVEKRSLDVYAEAGEK